MSQLKITFPSAIFFKKMFEAIKDLVSEINIEFDSAGKMSVQGIDSSHVSLVSLILTKESFIHYECPVSQIYGVSIPTLLAILKMADKNSQLTLDASNKDIMNVIMHSSERKVEFQMNLIEIDHEVLQIPDIPAISQIDMDSSEFYGICHDFIPFSDTLKIRTRKTNTNNVTKMEGIFECAGDKGKGKILIENAGKSTINSTVDDFSADFSLKHLSIFTKAQNLSPKVTLRLNENAPIDIRYIFENSIGCLTFYLAPKIPDNSA